jgi:lipopolysaccharide/colanic/teichoic acid biosynthesis glycosyltransferase
MYKDSESKGKLTIDSDVRITKPGKFLRKYKIDELPQLIDVLLGRMSLVGPRPEVKEFIELYPIDIRSKVLSVRPGITDMASIEMIDENEILGKYKDVKQAYIDIILPIKQQHYVNYVDNRNILLDIKIIYLTFRKIFSR